MKSITSFSLGACLLAVIAGTKAADVVQPQKDRVPASGVFVPVCLDEHARDYMEIGLPAEDGTVRTVSFDLVQRAGVNHLFLKSSLQGSSSNSLRRCSTSPSTRR
jgi:hypothetical protein